MPERLELTKNAHFYLPKDEVTDEIIQSIMDAATDNMEAAGEYLIDEFREPKVVEDTELSYVYSIKVFPSVRPVYFLDDQVEDRIHAYIIIIEYSDHYAVMKKSCSNITEILKENFELIGSTELTRTFSQDAEYQKMALRNMTISDRAMRARSYEAADLKGLLSTHSAGRSIPYYLKIRQGASTKSISGTGRIVEASQRISIDDIALWVKEQVDLLANATDNEFLEAFAKKVELVDVLAITDPNALLIESTQLSERIEKDGLAIKYKLSNGKLITVSNRVKNKLFQELEKTFEVNSDDEIVGFESDAKIRRNTKSLTIQSKNLANFRVIENGKEVTLQKFIVKNGFYSITFSDPKYMYFMGACFQDSSGVSEINSILDILQPHDGMSAITSEKGEFSPAQTNFTDDSMFHFVEHIHSPDDYIFCDDLGIEWADHITFNLGDGCISFIHSKHGDQTTSASKLHDVVGQGIKNLGNMFFDKTQFIQRIEDKFNAMYSNNSVQTDISRVRKGDLTTIEQDLEHLLKNYQLYRKCILSCSFMSKSSIETQFQKIQRGESVPGHITQLLWIISSFAHAVRDMNAIPIIYCAP
ncbi:hypothetical protein K6P01_004649 [Vibrio parahaemolyticus]|uniref:hypothetical protein n=1 Tax=Vibrio parahaemolyticus TaxID=670 RepID=UPI0007A098A2|nr:hypothetical protein [Vibrio parahaemolyticus]EHZ7351178.1 hypothetical protein [Vibrio parahaemolyticus]EJG0384254.1 hypothetical protein [Vibrio parahaemolyticus]EJG0403456.1 hypothetical protein [Vibrio parahaemolyticus]ELN8948951.1 hypothetical protein [Vibrio parahaemolyticus]KYY16756.1 hypothetical protein AWJ16_17010 [Vibrio parahaemolyticus]